MTSTAIRNASNNGRADPSRLPPKLARNLVRSLFSRSFVSFWIALVLATMLGVAGQHLSRTNRVTNIDLSRGDLPHSYMMFSKTQQDRGYLVARHKSTIRRSRDQLPGDVGEIRRFGAKPESATPDHWMFRSENQGTLVFIPVEEVKDWDYPFLYRFVCMEFPQANLPEVTWTQLFVSRVYKGLYLRIDLPFDPDLQRELLSVQGNQMTVVDTRLSAHTRLYADLIAADTFPALSSPAPALAWLDAHTPDEEKVFLLESGDPQRLSLLPLPVSPNTLMQRLYGRPPEATTDDRCLRWTTGDWTQSVLHAAPFDDAMRERFRDQFDEYKTRFRAALKAYQTASTPPRTFAAVLGFPRQSTVDQAQRTREYSFDASTHP